MIGAKRLPSFLGLDARHYPVAGRRDKVVITLSGSEGGLWLAKKQARWLQSQGIPALALGYFRTLHTGTALSLVPLEIIEQAIHFLQAQGYARIGILGFSKGAELALVAATHYPALSCVVAKTPSWFVAKDSGEKRLPALPAGAVRVSHCPTLHIVCDTFRWCAVSYRQKRTISCRSAPANVLFQHQSCR